MNSNKLVLIVEDADELHGAIRQLIEKLGYGVVSPFASPPRLDFGAHQEAILARTLELFEERVADIHAIILDLAWSPEEQEQFNAFELGKSEIPDREEMPAVFQLLNRIENSKTLIPVIICTQYPLAVFELLRSSFGGMTLMTYIKKPDEFTIADDLEPALKSALNYATIVKGGCFIPPTENGIKLLNSLSRLMDSDLPIFIEGASGTGKGKIAELIHALCGKDKEDFYHISFGARRGDMNLLRTELFGSVVGAYTGAVNRDGILVKAQKKRGTVFLDEIGKANLETQAILLKLAQERRGEKVGGERDEKVGDVTLIFAASEDLPQLEAKGEFIPDLRYRIRGHVISLPDIQDLKGSKVDLAKIVPCIASNPVKLSDADRKALNDYDFPGNHRQLNTVLERARVEKIPICDSIRVERDYEFRKEKARQRLERSAVNMPLSVDVDYVVNCVVSLIEKQGKDGNKLLETIKGLVTERIFESHRKNDGAAKIMGVSRSTIKRQRPKRKT